VTNVKVLRFKFQRHGYQRQVQLHDQNITTSGKSVKITSFMVLENMG